VAGRIRALRRPLPAAADPPRREPPGRGPAGLVPGTSASRPAVADRGAALGTAYMVRSGATYEESAGVTSSPRAGPTSTRRGVLAYATRVSTCCRMIYADRRWPGRALLLRPAGPAPRERAAIPYGNGRPVPGRSSWGPRPTWTCGCCLSAAEYGLASRDLSTFLRARPLSRRRSSSLWEHLAHRLPPRRSPCAPPPAATTRGSVGDWSDLGHRSSSHGRKSLLDHRAGRLHPYPGSPRWPTRRGDGPSPRAAPRAARRALATTRLRTRPAAGTCAAMPDSSSSAWGDLRRAASAVGRCSPGRPTRAQANDAGWRTSGAT